MTNKRKLKHLLVVSYLVAALIASLPLLASAMSQNSLDPNTRFYVPKPIDGARQQIADLISSGNKADANLIREMIETSQAVWFTSGTPHKVQQDVKNTVKLAVAKKTVPVLVAYNIPFRDCSQFSAGGATSVTEYKAWIDGFAAGIGDATAVVIVEPDGLGIIPWYNPYGSDDLVGDPPAPDNTVEWCQPPEADPKTAADDRFEMLNYAVDTLKAQPNVSVYLDATHSAWLGVGDAADRLVLAGVADADGLFLNVSNYQYSVNQVMYGTWISKCIAMTAPANRDNFKSGCPNQYWNGGPDGTKIAELLGPWTGVGLSRYGEWSDTTDTPELNTSGLNTRYASVTGTTHFVIDTSRNGQGPWQPPAYPDPQDWCNPPDRGVGLRPTADTGNELLDAYLWIKIPGASDGECTRGLGPGGTTVDTEWGLIDPAAGRWFPEMALELVRNANPPLP